MENSHPFVASCSFDGPVKEACNPVNGKGSNRPGGDDPQRRTFGGVVVPQVGLCAPGFDSQPAKNPHEDDQPIGAQIGARDDGQRHEQEDADQQPVHVQPPGTVPVDVGEHFLGQRPPDVDDQEDGQQEAAEQNR